MKKYILIILALCCIAAPVPAQTLAQPWGVTPNPPIIDITNLIMALENGVEMYKQLTSMYQIIKTNIDKLNQQRKNFHAFDIRQLSIIDPLGSWRNIMTYGNRMLTYEENITGILNRKDIKIGSGFYSLNDLFSTNLLANYDFIDPFERRLTQDEKAIFNQKYGISYGNYIRYHTIGKSLSKKAVDITAYNGKLEEELTADREAILSIIAEQGDGSWVQEQQKINSLLLTKNHNLKTRTKLVSDMAQLYGSIAAVSRLGMELHDKNNDADFGDSYLKIIEKTGHKNDYIGHLYPEH